MRGRPSRQPASNLCSEFERVRSKAGMTRAEAARVLDVNPSTLSRSLNKGALSKDLQAKAERYVHDYEDAKPALTGRRVELEGALHILRKLDALSPHLQQAIKIALDVAKQQE